MKSRSMAAPRCRIGISGWTFPGWRGRFYPEDLPHSGELAYASRQVNSIEINGTFYALQTPSSYRKWYRETPQGFVFAVKGGRFITHIKRLKEVEGPLANFFASGILGLQENGRFSAISPLILFTSACMAETNFMRATIRRRPLRNGPPGSTGGAWVAAPGECPV